MLTETLSKETSQTDIWKAREYSSLNLKTVYIGETLDAASSKAKEYYKCRKEY